MFGLYGWQQEVGLTPNIINTAANKGALLALVAMAQTIPVLTGGLDLSVGMIFLLTNCLASVIVNGDPMMTRSASSACCSAGARLRHAQRRHRRLWAAAADHRDAGDQRDLSTASRWCCARSPAARSISDLADFMTRSIYSACRSR